MLSRSSNHEFIVLDMPGVEEAQALLQITPEEVAISGLRLAANPDVPKKSGGGWFDGPLGYVASHDSRLDLYMRAIFPHPEAARTDIALPTDKDELIRHMGWHAAELDRLKNTGVAVPTHYSILYKSTGGEHWGVFTVAERIDGEENSKLLQRPSVAVQEPLRRVAGALLSYYTDATRPNNTPVIRDIYRPRQFTGLYLHDLDPYQGTDRSQITRLAVELEALVPCQEVSDLQRQVEAAAR